MRKILLLLVMCAGAISAMGQQLVTSDNVPPFTSVTLTGKLSVELIAADKAAIEIKLHDSDINKLKWTVLDNDMSITLRPTPGRSAFAEVKIFYDKTIDQVILSGAELHVKEAINSAAFTMSASGGARITATLECIDLLVNISGNSVAIIDGFTKYLTVNASEKCKFDSRNLDTMSAQVDASHGSEIYVNTTERLITNIKSGGTIFYKGKPSIIRETSSRFGMGGSVNSIEQ